MLKTYVSGDIRNAKILHDYVLVDPDPDKNKAKIIGEGGKVLELILDPYRENKANNSVSGIVVCLPEVVTKDRRHLTERLAVGDRVYFHFNMLEIAREAKNVLYDEAENEYCLIPLSMCYARVRTIMSDSGKEHKELAALGEFNLLQPIREDESKFKTASGIFLKTQGDVEPDRAKVCYVGQEESDDYVEIKPGDITINTKDADIPVLIENEKFFRQRFRNILAVVE